MYPDKRAVARDVIAEAAPNELPLFEQLWTEAMEDTDLLRAVPGRSDHHLGAGGIAETSMISLLVIPLVVGVAKDLVVFGVKEIYDYGKKYFAKTESPPSEEELVQLAQIIADKFRR
jgi:hypothetical protein